MAIWFDPAVKIEHIRPLGNNTMGDHLGIVFTEIGEDYIKARMPVDPRTKQPYGLLHGGASATLAETLGSVASALVVDHSKFNVVGIEINANHLRGVREGFVTGVVKPLHTGRTIHVWEIKIYDEREKLVCISRLTVSIIAKQL
ncbi:hotdog fold thioesterase [Puia dinghuensis]|uniref:Thioesterase n=1 Tax=Puia dinghuensis TaxID=1792502 RepID=A0A8J2UCD5_9BACT|nr:hotdog fold thioesterase [Puia dinghuensis]GGA95293.1 thioesterase [Puia dinghuensis]